MKRRLVITGMGAITPVGLDVNEYWNNLLAGRCGVGEITRFPTDNLPVKIAAQAPDIDFSSTLPRSVLKSSSLFMRYAFLAGLEAWNAAGLDDLSSAAMGLCVGSALGGVAELVKSGEDFYAGKSGRISPHLVPRSLGNIAAAHFAIAHGMRGPALSLDTACSAGGDAVMTACMLILAGEAEGMLVMGGESILSPAIISSLAAAKALSRRNDSPPEASRPFDLNRDGFVIGEGGGALVIETEERARERKAPVLAEITGWANSMDAYHITAPEPDGRGAAECMRKALARGNMAPTDIDYINAHGTATQLGDLAETKAIKRVFGDSAPVVSSTKGATGHLMGAGGLTEIIACVKAIETGLIPPTLNLTNPDPGCDLDYVPLVARKKSVRNAMSNSLGFGGQNSSVIVSRF